MREDFQGLIPLTPENWIKKTVASTPKLPVEPRYEDVYFETYCLDESVDIETLTFFYIDGGTGRISRQFEFTPHRYTTDYPSDENLGLAQDLALSGIGLYSYSYEGAFQHPLLRQPTPVVRTDVRYWHADSRGRKISKNKIQILNCLFEERLGNAPRPFIILSESEFERRNESKTNVDRPELWREKFRTFLFAETQVFYLRDSSGLLAKSGPRVRMDDLRVFLFPQFLGQAEELYF